MADRAPPEAPLFDPEELRGLRAFFLDEASDHLAGLAGLLEQLRRRPDDRAALTGMMRELHTIKGSAGSVMLDALAAQAHALEDLVLALEKRSPSADDVAALGRGFEQLAGALATVEREVRGPAPRATPALDAAPAGGAATAPEPPREPEAEAAAPTVRVEVERIDELLDAASELVFDRTRLARRIQELHGVAQALAAVRAQLAGLPSALEDARAPEALVQRATDTAADLATALGALAAAGQGFSDDVEGLARTSATLQERVRRVRVMAVSRLFSRLDASLRDLGRKEGKQLVLRTTGEDTEIAKDVVERIAEPLLHLLRNAVAHGIEPPGERQAHGKPPAGQLTLAARHVGDAVEISVEDDGRGVDREAVRRALVAGRRLSADAAALLDDDALLDALFLPGFSTRTEATDVAGRGVGLDAVREALRRLGGTVRVRSTEGRGTSVTVRLPLSTAVQQALLFKVGGQVYAVPATRVEEAVTISPEDLRLPGPEGGPEAVRIPSGETLPLVRLGALLGVPPPPGASTRRALLVVTAPADLEPARFALTCDKVIGPREIVVRSLGPLLGGLPLYAGATISGAGKVQLILDVAALAREAARGVRATRPQRGRGPRRVLVADDSRSIREAAALLFTQSGWAVELVPDGWDAWELLQDRPFDLLVTDLEMPRLDGHELITRVRSSPELAELPILVVTSRTAETVRMRLERAGADGFLGKPLRGKALLEAAEAAVAARRPEPLGTV